MGFEVEMLHAGCCSEAAAGLALAQGEDPEVLANDLTRAHQVFLATSKRLPSGNAFLANQAILINNWLQSAFRDMGAKRFRDARIKVGTIYGLLGDFAARVGQAGKEAVTGGGAQAKAEAGGSFLNQVLATLGLIPESAIYRPEIPAAAAMEGFGKWLLPVGAGLLLLVLLRR